MPSGAPHRWRTRHPGPAAFSPCTRYRYRLERIMRPGPALGIVMMNPSEADADFDDPTIDRVQALCQRLEFGRAIIGNLFALRSTHVAQLGGIADPVGPENDAHLAALAAEADMIVVAWGAAAKHPKAHPHRWRVVAALLEGAGKPLHCLAHLKGNHPRHPQILIHEMPLPVWRRPA